VESSRPLRVRPLAIYLTARRKDELKQAYMGNRLYELCMMRHRQFSKDGLPYESFSDTFSDAPKDTRTAEDIRAELVDLFTPEGG
jgi:hypothetical protein